MKADSIVFAVAGMCFGVILGWVLATQQAVRVGPAAPAAASGCRHRRTPQQPAALDEARVQALTTTLTSDPKNAGAACAAGQHLLRRRALRRRDHVVRAGAEARSEERGREHRPRRQLLLHEPDRRGAEAVRALAEDRSEATRRRCSTRASCWRSASRISKGASAAWQKVVELAPNSPEGQAAQARARGRGRGASPARRARRRPEASAVIRWILLAILVLLIVVARAFWRFVDGIIEAAGGTPRSRRRGGRRR